MIEKIIIAGAGGQGIMLLGKVLAIAAMRENKQVTWMPSYGAAVRGGAAYCMVIISDKEIGSPYVEKADTLIIMNQPALEKFKDRITPQGLLIVNNSLVKMNSEISEKLSFNADSRKSNGSTSLTISPERSRRANTDTRRLPTINLRPSVCPDDFVGIPTFRRDNPRASVFRRASQIIKQPFTDIAAKLGNLKVANMVTLGCYITKNKIVDAQTTLGVIEDLAPENKKDLIGINKQALKKGAELIIKK